jgi:hypothetical protein
MILMKIRGSELSYEIYFNRIPFEANKIIHFIIKTNINQNWSHTLFLFLNKITFN